MPEDTNLNAAELATELTVAWLGNPNNRVSVEDVPAFLQQMHAKVAELAQVSSAPAETAEIETEYKPAVSVRKSLASRDHIVSMIDGKPYKSLRRHLSSRGLTPEQYRARYKLKADYPMVAEGYSEARRAAAKKIGLGRKPGATAPAEKPAPRKRAPRQPKAA